MLKKWRLAFLTISATAILAGCASAPPPPEDTPPIYLVSTNLGGSDPIEPFNRAMYEVNEFGLRWVFRPVGYVWGSIFPAPVIKSFNNFTDNLGFPVRMLAAFSQAEWKSGGIVFARFLVNSTAGVAGFFEVAEPYCDLPRQNEDFGQAFARWGIGSGCYLFLPAYGSSNVRDAVGSVFDTAADPKTYIYFGQTFTAINRLSAGYESFADLYKTQADPYELLRDLSLQQRKLLIESYERQAEVEAEVSETEVAQAPAVMPDLGDKVAQASNVNRFKRQAKALDNYSGESANDTIAFTGFVEHTQSIWPYLSLWNSDFSNLGQVRSLEIMADRDKLKYKFYRNKSTSPNAPLVIILCGLGGHFESEAPTALANLCYSKGYSVAVLTNTIHPDFLVSATEGYRSGYTPDDANIIVEVINSVIADLQENKDIDPAEIILAGYSHGAMQSLYITATKSSELAKPVAQAIAINPPVDPIYATEKMDGFVKIAESWSGEEAQENISNLLGGFLTQTLNPNDIDPQVAKAVVGLAFRFTLRDAILTAERYRGIPTLENHFDWWRRYSLYLEINQKDFDWYINDVLIDYYRQKLNQPDLTVAELKYNSSLYPVAEQLHNDERLYVIHTTDDFLISDEDAEFLSNTFGERLILFDRGGHLGQLVKAEVQESITNLLPSLNEGE